MLWTNLPRKHHELIPADTFPIHLQNDLQTGLLEAWQTEVRYLDRARISNLSAMPALMSTFATRSRAVISSAGVAMKSFSTCLFSRLPGRRVAR